MSRTVDPDTGPPPSAGWGRPAVTLLLSAIAIGGILAAVLVGCARAVAPPPAKQKQDAEPSPAKPQKFQHRL